MKLAKHILVIALALILMLALPCTAMADAIRDWNLSCTMKTLEKTTVYSLSDRSKAIAIIPAETYVQVTDSADGWDAVSYTTASGIVGYGYVETLNLTSAMVEYTDAKGNPATVHELLYNNGNILNPDGTIAKDEPEVEATEPAEDESPAVTDEPAAEAPSDQELAEPVDVPAELPASAYEVTWAAPESDPVPVMLVTLGVANSRVFANEEWLDVPTAELVFETEVAREQNLAIITAPNSGECSLRSRADADSRALAKCKAGRVVVVLEIGERFCKVNFEGQEGYILTNLLRIVGQDVQATGSAVLSVKGATTGKATVNIRNSADKDTAKIAVWPVGTAVTIFSYENGWYEIEHEGVHGYVMDDYVTVNE